MDREEWMSVLLNSKDGALTQAFQDNGKTSQVNQGFIELQRTLVTFIRGLPGNDKCCDCGSTNGESFSYLYNQMLALRILVHGGNIWQKKPHNLANNAKMSLVK